MRQKIDFDLPIFKTNKDSLDKKVEAHGYVLIVDDVTTSGATLGEILRTIRIFNDDNKITIFSLIGRKDLMAESV